MVREGCQDIDDALHARPLPNGNIEAGVRTLKFPLSGYHSFKHFPHRHRRCLPLRTTG